MKSFFRVATFSLLFASTLIPSAQTLTVQVLNGKNGKPLPYQHVVLIGEFGSGGRYTIGDFHTEADGIFIVSQIDQKTRSLDVYVEQHHPCAKNRAAFSLTNILSTGVVSENLCNRKLQRGETPGTLILFVRDETFVEKMAH